MLKDMTIKNAKVGDDEKAYKLSDGGGLYLLVTKSGKYWRYDYRINGKRKTLAIGKYPDIPLATKKVEGDNKIKGVRAYLAEAKDLVIQGIDPSQAKKDAKRKNLEALEKKNIQTAIDSNSFEVVAAKWFNHKKQGWMEGHSCKVYRRLEMYIFPYIGQKSISKISKFEVIDCIDKVVQQGRNESAKRLFQNVRNIFDYAYARDWVSSIPMPTDHKLIVPQHTAKKMPAITDKKKIGHLLRALDEYQGTYVVRMALKLLPYVSLRAGEYRKSCWKHFDLEKSLWIIPAKNRKLLKKQKEDNENVHIVPLPTQAVKLLQELRNVTGHGNLVFPSVRGDSRPMSENTINTALHSMGYKGEMVGHGFRTIFSTLLNEKGFNPDAIEKQLAHKIKDKVRDAYNRTNYIIEREKMMQSYADYLDIIRTG